MVFGVSASHSASAMGIPVSDDWITNVKPPRWPKKKAGLEPGFFVYCFGKFSAQMLAIAT